MSTGEKALYRLRVPDEVAGLIRHLHPQVKRKVKSALKLILSEPHAGRILKEDLKGLLSYGVGRIRIVYRIGPKRTIELITIGPRKTIYEETYRALKKEVEGSYSQKGSLEGNALYKGSAKRAENGRAKNVGVCNGH